MKILAIDTVTEMCSVALYAHEKTWQSAELVKQSHTDVILPMVDNVLAEGGCHLQELDAIAFTRGPGSFTGLRVCAGVTQGLALAHDLPVVAVSSLAVLAQGAWRQEQANAVLACIDARRGEVYWACYQVHAGLMQLVGTERVSPPAQVQPALDTRWHGVGTGFETYAAELSNNPAVTLTSVHAQRYPLAEDVLPFAIRAVRNRDFVDASAALPVYLRDNVATPSN